MFCKVCGSSGRQVAEYKVTPEGKVLPPYSFLSLSPAPAGEWVSCCPNCVPGLPAKFAEIRQVQEFNDAVRKPKRIDSDVDTFDYEHCHRQMSVEAIQRRLRLAKEHVQHMTDLLEKERSDLSFSGLRYLFGEAHDRMSEKITAFWVDDRLGVPGGRREAFNDKGLISEFFRADNLDREAPMTDPGWIAVWRKFDTGWALSRFEVVTQDKIDSGT